MTECRYVIQTTGPDGKTRDEVCGDTIQELAEQLEDAGFMGGRITIYDNLGFVAGWVSLVDGVADWGGPAGSGEEST